MQIIVTNAPAENLDGIGEELTYLEGDEIRGDVRLLLEHEGDTKSIDWRKISLPLFVAETKLFLKQARSCGLSTWSVGFAPFLDGEWTEEGIILRTGSQNRRDGKIVEVLSESQLEGINFQLDDLERKFGRLRSA